MMLKKSIIIESFNTKYGEFSMKKIFVLGGGYANLAFLKSLDDEIFSLAEFTLISKHNYHYESVLLHEVASGSKKNIIFNFDEILPKQIRFIKDNVLEIKNNEVIGQDGKYTYDILVVGLGFSSDDFGILGVREYAFCITNYDDSILLFESIQKKLKSKSKLDVAICGGGFSGVELISSLAENFRGELNLVCIEAMPNILPMFDEESINNARIYLSNFGIKFSVNSKILEVKNNAVLIENNGIESLINADIIVWMAGVKGNVVIENSKIFNSKRSKIEVDNYLQPLGNESMNNIFAIGDCAALKDSNNRFHPPTAQIAIAQGEYLARVMKYKLENKPLREEFKYQSKGTICSLGNKYAIGNIGNKRIKGGYASFIKKFIEFKWRYKLKGFSALFN